MKTRKSQKSMMNPGVQASKIVLVGMMGAGKSSVGWRLARRLMLPFFDSDREVENAAGCSIPDIYALWGEKAFKEAEKNIILKLLQEPAFVLSTGDGSFVPEDLRSLMLEKAVCVWLKADLAVIHRRVSCRRTRPQLFEGDSMHILEELLKERSAIYPQAHVSVTSHEETHDVTVDRVIEALNQLGGQAVSVG